MECLSSIWHIYTNRQFPSWLEWECLWPGAAALGENTFSATPLSHGFLWTGGKCGLCFSPAILSLFRKMVLNQYRGERNALCAKAQFLDGEERVWKQGEGKKMGELEILLQASVLPVISPPKCFEKWIAGFILVIHSSPKGSRNGKALSPCSGSAVSADSSTVFLGPGKLS